MYPLKSGRSESIFASRTSDSWLRACIVRPWWNVIAQNEHAPKHPRTLVSEKSTSCNAGTPVFPFAAFLSYIGWYFRVYGSSITASNSSVVKGKAGGFCTTKRASDCSTKMQALIASVFSSCVTKDSANFRRLSSLSEEISWKDGRRITFFPLGTSSSFPENQHEPRTERISRIGTPLFSKSAVSIIECSPIP